MKPSIPSVSTALLLGAFAALGLALGAHAAVPGQVSYQGLLLDAQGDPVTATVAMEFELFDAVSGGSSLWFESHPAVQVVDGVYDVVLGAITPITQTEVEGGTVYLEVSVEGETLSPRTRLLVVPYALRAAYAEQSGALGSFAAGYYDVMVELGNFDGQEPTNADPDEGLDDVDGDGTPNFADADNDGDSILDGDELAAGSGINAPTPIVDGTLPVISDTNTPTVVSVLGQNFVAGMSVQFGSQSPTPTNVTPTSFDVTVGPQPAGFVTVTVTRPNAESDSTNHTFAAGRFVFVTSTDYTGDLGGLAGADALCQSRADAASLGGTYQAWLADGTGSPATRQSQVGPYLRTNGTVVADDWADLTDGTLDRPIILDEFGVSRVSSVWTNVVAVGGGVGAGPDCSGWQSDVSGSGALGVSSSTSGGWTEIAADTCSSSLALYCFQQ